MEANAPLAKLACVMVGLPARGKTFIARKIARYLTWLGHKSRIFNVGNYRRLKVGAFQPADFFDPNNKEFNRQRSEVADAALNDMLSWIANNGEDGSLEGIIAASNNDLSMSPRRSQTKLPSGTGVAGTSVIAIYDATNSTKERRMLIVQKCKAENVAVMFIESICDDEELVLSNIREVKLSSPDYKLFSEEMAINDFKERIKQYEKCYETLDFSEMDNQISFVKLSNVGLRVVINNVRGYLQSRIIHFLMNLNIAPRSFYISRHGESIFNLEQKIGGNSDLSPQGEAFAQALPEVIKNQLEDGIDLTIWTSTLKRTIETAAHLPYMKLQWKQLNELGSGSCDGLTYDQIKEKYPIDYQERDTDKFNYRYHGGESYLDLVHRLEPVILELERHCKPNCEIYIVAHQAVVRAIYAYYHNIPHSELPYIKIPLHTLFKMTPRAYLCHEERIMLDVPAVDTFRCKPDLKD